MSQSRCGALIAHWSTEAGVEASRRPTPLLPPAGGALDGDREVATDKGGDAQPMAKGQFKLVNI